MNVNIELTIHLSCNLRRPLHHFGGEEREES
jgi:hypothetical protein